MKSNNERKRWTYHFWRLVNSLEMLCNTEDPFTLFPLSILFSLSILPFDFSSSLLPSLTLQKKLASRPWQDGYFETLVCLLLSRPAFGIKSFSLPQLCLWDSLVCRAVNRVGLDSVAKLSLQFSQSGMALGFCFFCISFINLFLCEDQFILSSQGDPSFFIFVTALLAVVLTWLVPVLI